MPRKYVRVSSTSSSDTSIQYSSSYSDSESADERRYRRARRRRNGRSPKQPKEPSESLHWWLARWLSSEFAKFAISVYEGGKECIRYLSNTALHALPSAQTDRELQDKIPKRHSRRHHRKSRHSAYPGGSRMSPEVRESRKSHRKNKKGRDERARSRNETYVSLNPIRGPKHGHRSHFSTTKQVPI